MDYPGVPVDRRTIKERPALVGVRVPARPHFGFMAVAPREAEIVDSVPPSYFGGNIDNWRAGKGTITYLWQCPAHCFQSAICISRRAMARSTVRHLNSR